MAREGSDFGEALSALTARRDTRQGAAIIALLLGVFALRVVVAEPVIGLGVLYIVPALVAARWFGRAGAVGVGLAGTGLFALGAVFEPQEHLLTSTVVRLVLFCGIGYAFAALLSRQRQLRGVLARQEGELSELRALKSALVPSQIPERPAVDLATCFVPAQERVAGDFFFVGEGPGDTTVVVVGDVVGKGLVAARRAAFVRAALATYASYHDDPCRLLELANTALIERVGTSEDFVTAACLVYRPADHRVAWALAGHPSPILLDDGERLNGISPGLPLGLDDSIRCAAAERRLRAGGGVLLFTDGLTEARRPFSDRASGRRVTERPKPELFGNERVAAVLAEHRGEEPEEVVQALRQAAERFTGGGLADDLCMVAVRARD
jgi:serine phosphatase RsbU (regulator of sigma subunit)